LEEVEKRLDELNKLKRKYGNSTEEILKLYGQIEQEIQAFDQRETHIETLEKDYKSLKTRLQELSHQLSDERKQAAQGFELQVMQELSALGMEKPGLLLILIKQGPKKIRLQRKEPID
jgi:DNA repair protein RecN (Recombination protein N)